jgi:hypothetical protein
MILSGPESKPFIQSQYFCGISLALATKQRLADYLQHRLAGESFTRFCTRMPDNFLITLGTGDAAAPVAEQLTD